MDKAAELSASRRSASSTPLQPNAQPTPQSEPAQRAADDRAAVSSADVAVVRFVPPPRGDTPPKPRPASVATTQPEPAARHGTPPKPRAAPVANRTRADSASALPLRLHSSGGTTSQPTHEPEAEPVASGDTVQDGRCRCVWQLRCAVHD